MKVLMISLDKNLLGVKGALGNAAERHRKYGEKIESLDIIVLNKERKEPKKISSKVRVYPTNSWSRFLYIFDSYRIGKKIFQKRKYDLVVCQDPFLTGLAGWLLKRKTKTKLIIHFHGDFLDNVFWKKENWLNPVLLLIVDFLIKKADVWRVVSKSLKKKLQKKGVSSENIFVIPTPVDLKEFEKKYSFQKIEELRNKVKAKQIILFVGRLVKAKNLFLLIEVFRDILKEYKETVLFIVGEGKEREKLQKKIEKYNLKKNVFLWGGVDHDLLGNFYATASFLVLPSTNESFGKVILEAAIFKKPAIVSATAGGKELVLDKVTGLVVPVNDKKSLKEGILFLLKNKDKAKLMGESAYWHIKKKFDEEENIEKIIKMWETAVQGAEN